MPLVVLCGHPSSGKSTVAAQLAALFTPLGLAVTIIDEPSLHCERNTSYAAPAAEKNTRAKLKSAVERSVSKKSILILDSLNNIKGYRYELWCIARAAGTRYCMVHVDTALPTCRAWNEARPEEQRYTTAIFDDLAGRFERPDSRNRWDSPLFTLHPDRPELLDVGGEPGAGAGDSCVSDEGSVSQVLAAIAAAMTDTTSNVQAQVAKVLVPNMATSNPALLATNTLHDIDQAAQDVISAIVDAQTAAGGGAAQVVSFGEGVAPLNLTQTVNLAELRRLKREFLKLATKITFARLQDGAAAKRVFVDFLRDKLGPGAAPAGAAAGLDFA